MKIAVFSDSHDHIEALSAALARVKELGITTGLHLGDFCAPFITTMLADSGLKWFAVWGNNDGDKLQGFRITAGKTAPDGSPAFEVASGDFMELTLGERKLFLTHYPDIARIAALSGQFEAVFFGHNHKQSSETLNNALLANPGELCGTRFGVRSFMIYDTDSNTVEHLEF